MTQNEMSQHVKILGWIHIIFSALFLVIGAFVAFLLVGIGLVSMDTEAMGVLGIVGIFVAMVMLVLSLPGLLAGYGLLKRKSWGRILAIIVGALNLTNIPLGTILGLYTLYILLQSEANEYFSGLKMA